MVSQNFKLLLLPDLSFVCVIMLITNRKCSILLLCNILYKVKLSCDNYNMNPWIKMDHVPLNMIKTDSWGKRVIIARHHGLTEQSHNIEVSPKTKHHILHFAVSIIRHTQNEVSHLHFCLLIINPYRAGSDYNRT